MEEVCQWVARRLRRALWATIYTSDEETDSDEEQMATRHIRLQSSQVKSIRLKLLCWDASRDPMSWCTEQAVSQLSMKSSLYHSLGILQYLRPWSPHSKPCWRTSVYWKVTKWTVEIRTWNLSLGTPLSRNQSTAVPLTRLRPWLNFAMAENRKGSYQQATLHHSSSHILWINLLVLMEGFWDNYVVYMISHLLQLLC